LDLKDITLVVQDWGGPIGLSYAVNNPENVKNLIIINTWMWPVKGDPHYEKFSNFAGAGFGKFMIKYFNFFAKRVMKMVTGDKSKLTKHIHNHYIIPLKKIKTEFDISDDKLCFKREDIEKFEKKHKLKNPDT